jgi:hypothetical protein
MAADAASGGIWIGLCGELAADPLRPPPVARESPNSAWGRRPLPTIRALLADLDTTDARRFRAGARYGRRRRRTSAHGRSERMTFKKFTIINPTGFHTRPARLFVDTANEKFPDCEVKIVKGTGHQRQERPPHAHLA